MLIIAVGYHKLLTGRDVVWFEAVASFFLLVLELSYVATSLRGYYSVTGVYEYDHQHVNIDNVPPTSRLSPIKRRIVTLLFSLVGFFTLYRYYSLLYACDVYKLILALFNIHVKYVTEVLQLTKKGCFVVFGALLSVLILAVSSMMPIFS